MEFNYLLTLVADEPVFDTSLLLAGEVDPNAVRVQLSRWVKSGKIHQLRRGLYTLAPPYQRVQPHPFLVANRIQPASYVSLQSALAYYGMIPEIMQATSSVTTRRPGRWETPLGVYTYRHIKTELLRDYQMIPVNQGAAVQEAMVAVPEKALLDLVYLQPGGEKPEYLHELRLQNLDRLDLDVLNRLAETYNAPKMTRAARQISALAQSEVQDYETL